MRFYLVPIGQEFDYQGKTYLKSGPLTASCTSGGKDKLIPRSAEVQPVGDLTLSGPDSSDILFLAKDEVIKIFDSYHHHCLELLKTIDTEVSSDLTAKLKKYHQELLTSVLK